MTTAKPPVRAPTGLAGDLWEIIRDHLPAHDPALSKELRREVDVAVQTAVAGQAPALRTAMLIDALGGVDRTAKLLDVSKSQPSRWRAGLEQPSPEKARLLVDLDHVIARAHLLFTPEVARDWLTSANSYLGGARPIDVLRLRGSTEVIEALDAAMQGAYS